MSAYLHLDPVFVGGVTVAGHAGWSKLRSFGLAKSPAGAGVPGINEIVVTKLPDSATPHFFRFCAQGRHIGPEQSRAAARVDFTRAAGRGGEKTELSITLQGVVMEKDHQSGGTSAALERYRLHYRKMTYSHMPPSSPDVSRAVGEELMRSWVSSPKPFPAAPKNRTTSPAYNPYITVDFPE